MGPDPDKKTVEKAYARWAPIYDAVCGPIFQQGRRAAAKAAREGGGRILEIGVGHGRAFEGYEAPTEIIAIDLSLPMVTKAQQRLSRESYPYVRSLVVMDAHQLAFAD